MKRGWKIWASAVLARGCGEYVQGVCVCVCVGKVCLDEENGLPYRIFYNWVKSEY